MSNNLNSLQMARLYYLSGWVLHKLVRVCSSYLQGKLQNVVEEDFFVSSTTTLHVMPVQDMWNMDLGELYNAELDHTLTFPLNNKVSSYWNEVGKSYNDYCNYWDFSLYKCI